MIMLSHVLKARQLVVDDYNKGTSVGQGLADLGHTWVDLCAPSDIDAEADWVCFVHLDQRPNDIIRVSYDVLNDTTYIEYYHASGGYGIVSRPFGPEPGSQLV